MSNVFEKCPLPLCTGSTEGDYGNLQNIYDANGVQLYEGGIHDDTTPEEDDAIAAEIVKRCNAHDSLVVAGTAIVAGIDAGGYPTREQIDALRTALSKAVGEAQ